MSTVSLRIRITENNTAMVKTIKFDESTLVRDCIKFIHEQIPDSTTTASALASNYGLARSYISGSNESGCWLAEANQLQYYRLKNNEYLRKFTFVKVKMMDGTLESLLMDVSQEVGKLVTVFCAHIGITTPEEYSFTLDHEDLSKPRAKSLALVKFDKKSKQHPAGDRLGWLHHKKSLRAQRISETEVFGFKKKFFFFNFTCNSIELHLQFHQLHRAIINDDLWCTQEEAVRLAALQFQIQFGDYDPQTIHLKDLSSCLPKAYFNVKHVIELINAEHRKLHGESETIAKLEYIQLCESLPTYGITFFLVWEKLKGKKKLMPLFLGIERKAIFRADAENKRILARWPLTLIRQWTASPQSFTLDIGEYSIYCYSVYTTEGKHISEMIAGYIDRIIKNPPNRLSQMSAGSEKQSSIKEIKIREVSICSTSQMVTACKVCT